MSVQSQPAHEPGPSLHVATLAHDGIIWDAYLTFEPDLLRPATFRGKLRFEPPSAGDGLGPAETTVIIIEESYEDAVAKARSFDDRQLQALLRSTLPDPAE